MTCLGLKAVQAIPDGATIGAPQRAEGEDPAVVKVTNKRKKRYKSLLDES